MSDCAHPEEQAIRTIYYTACGACKQILIVTFCNYSAGCHADCALPSACVQKAREKFHSGVKLTVPAGLLEAARARPANRGAGTESRGPAG